MKIANNEIVVELPRIPNDLNVHSTIAFNEAIYKTEKLNPPRVVDVEALAKVIFYDKYPWDTWGEELIEDKARKYNCIEQAKHIAENLEKWLVEKT